MYPEPMIAPMREELTRFGVAETRTAADVEKAVNSGGTLMVVVNSVCGCAAGKPNKFAHIPCRRKLLEDSC